MTQTALDMAVIAGMAVSALTGWVACLFAIRPRPTRPRPKGIESDNFIQDRAGWRILGDGIREFNVIQPTHVRIRQGNDTCPVCYSDQVEGESIDFEGDSEVTQRMECLDCESEWTDAYTLTMRILNVKGTQP